MEINKTELKKILSGQRENYQRYLGLLKEGFDGKVKTIAEQYTDIRKTLASHSKTLASHSKILVLIQEDIEITKVDIEFIKNSLKKKVDLEEFEALEKRVLILESKK